MCNVSNDFARDFKCDCENLYFNHEVLGFRCLGNNLLFNFNIDVIEYLKFLHKCLKRSRPTVL